MAGNEWINGYLEAILDAGSKSSKSSSSSNNNNNNVRAKNISGSSIRQTIEETKLKMDQGFDTGNIGDDDHKDKEGNHQKLFSPIKYFVEEVVNSFDETDLHRTWIKVIATRNTRERSNRLENMCWRIWHLARKKKQIAWDDAQRLAKRRIEIEKGRNDAAEDLSELSEGEKEKSDANQAESPPENISRINSDMQIWSDDDKPRHLYIVLISLHGLVRGENMELGRDSDTGGQVKYVVELARALANMNGVYRVDLLTRQITSSEVDCSYGTFKKSHFGLTYLSLWMGLLLTLSTWQEFWGKK